MPEHFDRNGRDAGLRPYQARQRCQAFARRPKLPGLACALASLAALGACGSEPEPQPPESRPARLYTLDATDDLRTFRFPAVVEAAREAGLSFSNQSGRVERLTVEQGDFVRRGEIIAVLDQSQIREEIQQAENHVELARDAFERAQALIEAGAIARAVYEQRQTELNNAQSQLEAARERLSDRVLRAPFSGTIGSRQVELYEYVTPQQTIVTLQSTGPSKAVVQVPATMLGRDRSLVSARTRLIMDSAEDVVIPARFDSIGRQTSPGSLTYEAEFTFTPPAGVTVWPGMTGTLVVAVEPGGGDAPGPELAVPITAVDELGRETFVWVVDPETRAARRRIVELGEGVGEFVPVVEGLRRGETIVATGAANLEEGTKIRPLDLN